MLNYIWTRDREKEKKKKKLEQGRGNKHGGRRVLKPMGVFGVRGALEGCRLVKHDRCTLKKDGCGRL